MAQEAMPWEEFQAPQPPRTQGQGVVIPEKPEKPEKPPAPPSGYRFNAQGGLEVIPGGPADPNAPGQAGTQSEAANVGFYVRAVGANRLYENQGVGPRGIVEENFREQFPNIANTLISGDERQIADAAQEAFVEAILRSDSGAAVPTSEIILGRRRFFPQPGDREDVIAAKKQLRDQAIVGVLARAGTQAPKALNTWNELLTQYQAEEPTPEGEPEIGLAQPGEAQLTERDLEVRDRIQEVWSGSRGVPFEQAVQQVNDVLAGYNIDPLDAATVEALRADVNRSTVWNPRATGLPAGEKPSELGAAGLGLVRGYTAGLAEEALAQVSPLAAQRLQAGGEFATEEYPAASFLGELVGGTISPLARIGRAGTIGGEALRGGIYGGLYGAGDAPVEAGVEERLPGAFLGGLTGGTVGGGAQRFLGGRVPAAAGGGAPPPPVSPTTATMEALAAPATAREVIQAGELTNIPIMTSDIRQPSGFVGQSLQRLGERIPIVGTGGVRATQQEARQEAVRDFILENAGAVPADVEERLVTDVLRKRGDVVDKYTTLKGEVFANLAGAGDVPVNNTLKAIDDRIAELSTARTPAADEAIAKLQEIRTQAAGRDIQAMEAFRRDVLGKAWQDEALSVGASDRVKSAVQSLYGPFKSDMGEFILDKGSRRDYTKWRVADARLSDSINDAKRTTLKSILRSGEATPEVINNMLFSGKKSDVAALYKSLTPEGQAQARMAIVSRIAKDMGADQAISPEKFLTQLRKRSDQIGVFFSRAQQEEVKGLVRALEATRRAGTAGVATPTGQEAYALLLGGLGVGDVFATGGVGTALGGVFAGTVRAYESKPVRNLLAALSKTRPGSAAEQTILGKLGDKLKTSLPSTAASQQAAGAVAPEPAPGQPTPQMPR